MKNEPLFELIEAMTMSEKRFFKIFSQRHVIGETNDYQLMFDFIDKSDNISNEIIQKQPFAKNLSAEKNYLYRLVLKSLNNYYYEFSTKMKVQNLIINAEILAYKGLEEQALKLLEKGENITYEAELYPHLITIKQTQFEILSKLNKHKESIDTMSQVKDINKKYNNLNTLQTQSAKIYDLRQKKGNFRSTNEFAEFNEIINEFHQKEELPPKFQLFSLSISSAEAHSLKDYENELNTLKDIITLYESNTFLIEYSPKGYISSLYNLANTYRNLSKYDESVKILHKLSLKKSDKIISSSKKLIAFIFYLTNNLRLYIYLLSNKIELAVELYETVKKEYYLHDENIDKIVVYEHYMLVIKLNMLIKNYKEALKYSNIIINDNSFKKREDILTYVRLLNLIIHFELNNDFTIEYLSSSTINFLKRKKRLYKTEKEVINFITKFDPKFQKKLERTIFRLEELKKDPIEKSMFNFFDFHKWAKNKITSL